MKPIPVSDSLAKLVGKKDLWATCYHAMAKPTDHRCPECLATMRRCCGSSIGNPHRTGCASWRSDAVDEEDDDEDPEVEDHQDEGG